MLIFDGRCEWHNWAVVYLPTSIYEEAERAQFLVIESDHPCYRQGYDNWPNVRFTRGPYCWWVYFRCNFCGAYSGQPWLQEFRFTEVDAVNGCQEFYFVSLPSYKCPECTKVSSSITQIGPAERLGESDNLISCWFDWIKLRYFHCVIFAALLIPLADKR